MQSKHVAAFFTINIKEVVETVLHILMIFQYHNGVHIIKFSHLFFQVPACGFMAFKNFLNFVELNKAFTTMFVTFFRNCVY
jgi:hypothetical protein